VRLLALIAAAACTFALGSAAARALAPARMQVVAQEFSFSLSRMQVKPGQAVLELANFGQDPHDLRVQRVGRRHIAGTPVVEPGQRVELSLKLVPGRYVLWCSIAEHRQHGMRATLIVR
jgi:plastocyanin